MTRRSSFYGKSKRNIAPQVINKKTYDSDTGSIYPVFMGFFYSMVCCVDWWKINGTFFITIAVYTTSNFVMFCCVANKDIDL